MESQVLTRGCRRSKQLDHVAIRISQKDLPCPVRPFLPAREISAHLFQVPLPRIEVIRPQREMVTIMARKERVSMIGDEMQFLTVSQTKPGARKIESRPRNWFQLQHVAIKLAATLHVRDVNRNVIQFQNSHRSPKDFLGARQLAHEN